METDLRAHFAEGRLRLVVGLGPYVNTYGNELGYTGCHRALALSKDTDFCAGSEGLPSDTTRQNPDRGPHDRGGSNVGRKHAASSGRISVRAYASSPTVRIRMLGLHMPPPPLQRKDCNGGSIPEALGPAMKRARHRLCCLLRR